MKTEFLIIGAGMTGLSFANFIDSDDFLILEKDDQIGGWCKTVKQDGFVWDYSGHFFHFRNPEVESYLIDRMPEDEVVSVEKDSRILFGDTWIDFPFQKNIHQLPKADFIECLHDLVFRPAETEDSSFKAMLYEKFGEAITEKFLAPYNEKLYACDLEKLDRHAMGRFFPHAELEDIVRNMKVADNASYNSRFTYPKNGAIMYVNALMSEVPEDKVALGEGLASVDVKTKTATTTLGRVIEFEHLISSAPLDRFLKLCDWKWDESLLTYNKVLCFNLGFDSKGPEDIHWAYIPEKKYPFYRVGFYDNILGTDRMSLYVEIGLTADEDVDPEQQLQPVLEGLKASGIVTTQELVSHHSVILDPAYVHITAASKTLQQEVSATLGTRGIYSVGRYGGWTYCSIEDNVLEARALAQRFNQVT